MADIDDYKTIATILFMSVIIAMLFIIPVDCFCYYSWYKNDNYLMDYRLFSIITLPILAWYFYMSYNALFNSPDKDTRINNLKKIGIMSAVIIACGSCYGIINSYKLI